MSSMVSAPYPLLHILQTLDLIPESMVSAPYPPIDGKVKRNHQASTHLDELAQASMDKQEIRNCYDGLLSAAAAMTNSIFESLQEVGTCLLDKIVTDANGECVLRWHKAELGGDRRLIYSGELRHKTRRQRHACWSCFGKSRQPLTQQLLLDEVGVLREFVLLKFVIVLHSPILSGLRVMYPVKHTSV
ncbi:hypothetical protein HanXRQr2_Chr07g0305501 [Helianthus annuus]|uniref:Uncharacterized protein n=1 Tax=Helianthus annuus TaxID=4232 RepID=A0A9K3INE8_HELAN|nr:hypothetical protein HanXRQr2_Chr07g0305501 [Helianthus annuus]KAJ0563915.1 hypothetical protein HanHA89_Chr07g0268421 [Helianthus annuus]KAJ0731992.1 hypothetical protein HanOQP8_Chr07g0258171 [Helianthus annuus]